VVLSDVLHAAYSSSLTSLPAATNDVTRGYDPAVRRASVDFLVHGHLAPSPPVPAGFGRHPPQWRRTAAAAVERGNVSDRCAAGPGRWPADDYWAYSSSTTPPCHDAAVARRRYHVTTPPDVTDLVAKDERFTSVPPGMVAYAGLSATLYVIYTCTMNDMLTR